MSGARPPHAILGRKDPSDFGTSLQQQLLVGVQQNGLIYQCFSVLISTMKQILLGFYKNATALKAREFAILRSIPHPSSIMLKIANIACYNRKVSEDGFQSFAFDEVQ
ncbi:hypothetical protein SAMN05216326_1479 [Nitrosomonas marina]|uniref:Uncharacterized protein n=1 Tax=Nitrosomonas marina TaxID=917 RepID=A0A1I0FZJ1_9PROT|nr:hypothetical protein SAMN05216326_1479 [Nitrosomonas marina]